jgi:hypothetical protein
MRNDPAMVDTRSHERRARDAYDTPEWCVERLLDNFTFDTHVWEPCAGRGNISGVLRRYGYDVYESDIRTGLNFLGFSKRAPGRDIKHNQIITNPPYALAKEFIEQALAMAWPYGRVAMLLRNEYDCAKSRKHLWDLPFSHKLVLTKRPMWIEGTTGSPRHNFSWFLWDWNYESTPTIQYA